MYSVLFRECCSRCIGLDSSHMTASSSASCSRSSPPSNFVSGQWARVDNVVHGLSLARITGRWLGETPFMQVSTTWTLACPETVHRRPCMTREMETWLSDIMVGNSSVLDHRSRRPVLSPLRNCVDRCHLWPYWKLRCKLEASVSMSQTDIRLAVPRNYAENSKIQKPGKV